MNKRVDNTNIHHNEKYRQRKKLNRRKVAGTLCFRHAESEVSKKNRR